ncbi:3D domain-containing protein [Flavisericum labens]|uniref:3D domain-containing protein n=1 Tax=Flavisericum labens TaxID=3377112 RepID=UPI00387AB44A
MLIIIVALIVFSCQSSEKRFEEQYIWDSVNVTATAYNSLAYQTNSNPNITAFGDSLKPGMNYIAVSRNLLYKGLKHNTPVKIEGLKGIYWVKDKMHSKWVNRIDIYMGIDVKAAKNWGKKRVCIEFGIPKTD